MPAASDDWASPSGPTGGNVPAPGGRSAPDADPSAGFGFDPDHNWGLAGPVAPAAGRPVPHRPEAAPARPPALVAALALTYTGAALAVVELVVLLWQLSAAIVGDLDGGGLSLGAAFYLWLVGVSWLVLAAGVVATGVLTGRGRSAARVTLISLLSAIAVARLCGVTLAAAPRRPGAPGVEIVDLGVAGALTALVLGGLALAAAVLLVTPGVRDHFARVSHS